MKIRYFFFLGFADLAAAELAFLSHPLTKRAIAAPRFADSLPSASARLLAARTSFFNPATCFCNAFTLALAAELAEDFFLAAGRFLAAGLAAFFLTAGRVAFLLVAGRVAFFLAATFLLAAGLLATFLLAAGLLATFFFTAGLRAFFLTAGFLAFGFG
ncbi:MAG: hypothetical protein OER98_11150, partial [Gammaproteobacteria bacterium]|nr:hypothetical protein [Gammaproteobacteria bacterium]